jgi:hypothetical protein
MFIDIYCGTKVNILQHPRGHYVFTIPYIWMTMVVRVLRKKISTYWYGGIIFHKIAVCDE